jgi:glycosyltransferase involved in cell wall biosynthesis
MIEKQLLQINTVIIAEEIGLKAISDGWKSYIAYGRNNRPSKSYKIKIGNNWDVTWHGVETRILDRHGFASKDATRKLVEQIQIIKPNIIHLHNIHGYYLNFEILFNYLKSAKIPVVWTLHDCWPITGHCTYFSFIECNKWKTHCEKCPQKKEYPSSYWVDNSYNNFKFKQKIFTSVENMTIIPVSNWLAEIIKNSFLNKYPTKVINNGIDLNTFRPMNIDKVKMKYNLNDKFVLLGVANVWDRRKGLEDFIKLGNHLKEDEVIILVGLTKKQINCLPHNIIGITHTENVQELTELYSAGNVFINPTWEDNYPTTNLEAISCGTPVITYNTGGSPEAISSETGFIVEKGNLEEVRKAIDSIRKNVKAFYRNACRKKAIHMFNKEDRYAEYIQLYEEILS